MHGALPAELKVTYAALKTFLNDFGHDEYDVQRLVRSVMEKPRPSRRSRRSISALPRGRPRL